MVLAQCRLLARGSSSARLAVLAMLAMTAGCPGDVVESLTEGVTATGESSTSTASVGESSTAAMTAEGSSSLDPDSSSGSTPSTSSDATTTGDASTTGDATTGDATTGDATTTGDTTTTGDATTGDASTGDGSSSSSTDVTTSSDSGSSEGGTTGDPSECGNGAVEPGETCDDGNAGDGDGCDADCTDSVVTAVAVGGQHSCVLLDTGRVRCWGLGSAGQLGQGTTASIGDDELPSAASPLELDGTAVQLALGYYHSCARFDDGAVRCWGDAQFGQLGYGNTEDIGDDEPAGAGGNVDLGGPAVALVAGYFHTCALLEGGAARCWGAGADGQLGLGNTDVIGDDEVPSAIGPVDVGMEVSELAAGFLHTCARSGAGVVRCWGTGTEGQLGRGNLLTLGDDEAPSSVGPIDLGGAASQISLGGRHSCARLAGDVRCWGSSAQGQLGLGDVLTIGDDEVPGSVGPIDLGGPATAVAGGYFHTCATLDDGTARCWGFGMLGELGTADMASIGDDELPTSVPPIDIGGTILQLALLNDHACALLDDHAVRCWGLGVNGQLGYGDTDSIGDDEAPSVAGDVAVF